MRSLKKYLAIGAIMTNTLILPYLMGIKTVKKRGKRTQDIEEIVQDVKSYLFIVEPMTSGMVLETVDTRDYVGAQYYRNTGRKVKNNYRPAMRRVSRMR